MRRVLIFVLPILVIAVLILTFYLFSRIVYLNSHTSLASQNTSQDINYHRASTQNKKFPSPTPLSLAKSDSIPSQSPTPTPISKSVNNPSVTPKTVKVSLAPTPSLVGKSENIKEYLLQKINEYRVSQGLDRVQTDPYTCNFANVRVEEISRSFNHDGFRQRIESNSLPYPSYSKITENIAMTSDYTQVVNMWIASPGHAENMRQDTPYVCVGQLGNYFTYEGWRP